MDNSEKNRAVDLAELHRENERLRTIFAHVADALIVVELEDGRISEVNPAACEIFGYTRAELVGMHPWDLVVGAPREEIRAIMQSLRANEAVTLRRTFRRKDGEQRILELRQMRFTNVNGDQIVASCRDATDNTQLSEQLRDLTERRKAELELQHANAELERQARYLKELNQTLTDSEQRLRLAIETGRTGLWVWNSTDISNAGDWSPLLKEIFGLPRDAVVTHQLFLERVYPEDRERVDRDVMRALSGENGGLYFSEYRTVDSTESAERWVRAKGQAFFDSAGQPLRFIGTVVDISASKQAQKLLTRQNTELEQRIAERTAEIVRRKNELRLAIDSIPGLVWSTQPDGQIEYLNKPWLDYTGMSLEDAKGSGWQAAIHPEDAPGLASYWQLLLTTGKPGEAEARLLRFDGVYRWFLFRAVPLLDDAGKVVRWYGTNVDIEELRAANLLAGGQLIALTQTTESLAKESEQDKVLEHVLRTIVTQLDCHSASVWQRDIATDLVTCEAVYTGGALLTRGDARFSSTIPVEPISVIWPRPDLTEEGEITVLEDIRTGPPFSWKETLIAQGIYTVLIVPLMVGGQVGGIIGVRFTTIRKFCPGELKLVQALANHAMLAMQLRRLSLLNRQTVIVAERNRLARDIHDSLAQGFTGVIMQLEAAASASERQDWTSVKERMSHASSMARQSLSEARRSVQALRPRSLDNGTLCRALAELVQRMTVGLSLQAEFVQQGEPRTIPAEWEEGLLRIAQESLTNTVKHAQARTFRATISFNPENVQLQLVDDGRGFDLNAEHEGFGLLGMRERAEQISAQFIHRSKPGQGSEIVIILACVNQPEPKKDHGHS